MWSLPFESWTLAITLCESDMGNPWWLAKWLGEVVVSS